VEFDGRQDSLYHPVDLDGNRHMDYLNFRGEFTDVPIDQIRETFLAQYPGIRSLALGDFDADVTKEQG
jgi:hypothetical protein